MSNENKKSIKFSLFSDFHYLRGEYVNSLGDLHKILDRANDANVDFVLQAGDFCQNRYESPELDKAFLSNEYGLPVYGIYGNHDMERHSRDGKNCMALITPLLTNDKEVIWGTADGKISPDGSIGYYYFEKNGFRIVCLDTNYSWSPTEKLWEHNRPASWGPPAGNEQIDSLGPVQVSWLDEVLTDAAKKEIRCIVVSHIGFYVAQRNCPDANAVKEIFAKVNKIRKGTVIMAISGHWHTHKVRFEDNVFYLQMNTTRCATECYANRDRPAHYPDELVYDIFVGYDENGNELFESQRVNSADRGNSSWFYADAINAIVTVTEDGKITVDGMETDWLGGILPPWQNEYLKPYATSGEWSIEI